jgi:hypothetical protein
MRKSVLTTIVFAGLVAAAPASAGLTIIEGSPTTTGAGSQAPAEAECPGGSVVAGGGAFSTGGYSAVASTTSYPVSDTVWKEYTDVYSGPQNHYAYAICDTGNVNMRSETKSIPAEKTRTVKVDCPNGKNVYGGGFYTTGQYGESDAITSMPSGDGWKAKVHNFRDASTMSGSAYVLCGSKSSKVVSRTRPLKEGEQGSATAECPGNSRVSGGGAAISSKTASTWISTLYPPADHRWKAYAENGTGTDYKLTSYAICR